MYRWILRFKPVSALLFAGLAIWLLCMFAGKEPPLSPRYLLPQDAQLLTYPLEDSLVTAGYLNAQYLKDQSYAHCGGDFTPRNGRVADVKSLGAGVTLGTEFCENSVGNVVVARYDNVYNPTLDRVAPLVVRYYHLLTCTVREGDQLTGGQVIGRVDGQHQWYNHVHIEVDTDIRFPFHTPQVAERSSELLVRFPADGKSLLDPMSVLVVDESQRIELHPAATWCVPDELPRFFKGEFA